MKLTQPFPLDGISVIQLGEGIAVGYCGALLAACGANVIQVEPPGGDSTRFLPPFAPDTGNPEASGMHTFLSAGKQSAVLDLDAPESLNVVRRLLDNADVVLDGLKPGRTDVLGLGHANIRHTNPKLNAVSLSWFGVDGPRRDWAGSDAVAQALTGFIYPIGAKEGPPIIPGGFNAQITGGLTAFIAAMNALIGTLSGDPGAYVDVSIAEAQATYTETSGVRAAYDGARSTRNGLNIFAPTYPQTIYPASDGWIGVTVLTPAQWRSCCELLGAPELIDDPRFRSANARYENANALDPCVVPLFRKRTALEWFHEGQARRIPLALVPTMEDMLALDHFQAREVLATYEHPDIGKFTAATIPWKLGRTPLKRGGIAPRLGEHTELVRATVSSKDETVAPEQIPIAAHNAGLPLRHLSIADFTMGWSGPLATRHLADMGAEVVKIEACKYPDWWRGWEYTAESVSAQEHEKSPAFNQVNRNKLGVAIDLTRTEGRELALALIARADAVIENQATGVMAKLGLSYEDLREVNPQLVMLSLPAFGAEGPWAGYRGYGSTVEHGAGLPHLTGDEGGPPVQTHVAYGDACGGLNAVAALLVALFHRQRHNEGQRAEISQVECIMQLGVHGTICQGLLGKPPPRTGNRHPVYVPHGCFPGADTDSWLIVSLTDDEQWPALAHTIERPDLAQDKTLATAAGRRCREDEIEKALTRWTTQRSVDAAMRTLQSVGVPAAVVQPASALGTDEGFLARGFWLDVDRAVVGSKPHPLAPWRYNGNRTPIERPAPLLGEHNHLVLGSMLGRSDEAVARLERDGVIGTRPLVG
jgi:crotonobetainyl-CoA:carnitine CoA-transferase CaiB-like acyl-CoA transferase